jgi:hypothetical protein
MPGIQQFFLRLLSLSRLASTPQPPYDCSAIQAGNSQYNLSALAGDYEVDGINDGTTKSAYAINICEDLNSALRSRPTSGNGTLKGFSP